MTIEIQLVDGRGSGGRACVTSEGQLIVAPAKFSTASSATMTTDDTPVNLWGPMAGKKFIITDILLYANRNVGVNDATVSVYESTDGAATATQSKVILTTEMVKQRSRDFIGLNLEVTAGSWVNVVTDDDDVFITIMGYYIKDA